MLVGGGLVRFGSSTAKRACASFRQIMSEAMNAHAAHGSTDADIPLTTKRASHNRHGEGADMDHDHDKENWSRTTNRYCECPPFRYNPRFIHKRETNPDCPQHGNNHGA